MAFKQLLSENLANAIKEIGELCDQSGKSTLYEYGNQGYKDSIRHFIESSAELAQVAVQPGNEEDLAEMMRIIGKYRVPFAVQGGGHAMAPTFSSTTGIQIYMSRFAKVHYDGQTNLVSIGSGCLWQQVYRAVGRVGRNVIGGSSRDTHSGVGVAGWLLGGGYSVKSNGYGVGIDSTVEYDIVTPTGVVLRGVNATGSHSDLFQALRGGGNNFGIVTKFVIKSYPQEKPYTTQVSLDGKEQAEDAKNAMVKFVQTETRTQASIIFTFKHTLVPGKAGVEYTIPVFCYYDAEIPQPNPFQEFLDLADVNRAVPAHWTHGQTIRHIGYTEEEYVDQSAKDQANLFQDPAPLTPLEGIGELPQRGRFGCVMISTCNKQLLDEVDKQATEAAKDLGSNKGVALAFDVWPAHKDIFKSSPPGAAWPHKPEEPYGHVLAYFRWQNKEDDTFWLKVMNDALDAIRDVALAQGLMSNNAALYSNFSMESVPAYQIYRENLNWLMDTKRKYDPENVMGLAGGHKIPFMGPL